MATQLANAEKLTVLVDESVSLYLDDCRFAMRLNTGERISLQAILRPWVRVLVDAMESGDLDISQCASEEEINARMRNRVKFKGA